MIVALRIVRIKIMEVYMRSLSGLLKDSDLTLLALKDVLKDETLLKTNTDTRGVTL